MENVWSSHLAMLKDDESSPALGMLIALSAEVFLLKAEVARLRLALHASGVVSPDAELAAGETSSFAAWLSKEQVAFTAPLLRAWAQTDEAPDVSGIVTAETPAN